MRDGHLGQVSIATHYIQLTSKTTTDSLYSVPGGTKSPNILEGKDLQNSDVKSP